MKSEPSAVSVSRTEEHELMLAHARMSNLDRCSDAPATCRLHRTKFKNELRNKSEMKEKERKNRKSLRKTQSAESPSFKSKNFPLEPKKKSVDRRNL